MGMNRDMPLLAKEDALEGTIIFCPLEVQHRAAMESASPSEGSAPSIFDGGVSGLAASVSSAGGGPGSVGKSSGHGSSPWY